MPPQVQPYRDAAAQLEDFEQLKALHYDAAKQQFLDFGTHSEDVSLQVRLQEAHGLNMCIGGLRHSLKVPSCHALLSTGRF